MAVTPVTHYDSKIAKPYTRSAPLSVDEALLVALPLQNLPLLRDDATLASTQISMVFARHKVELLVGGNIARDRAIECYAMRANPLCIEAACGLGEIATPQLNCRYALLVQAAAV